MACQLRPRHSPAFASRLASPAARQRHPALIVRAGTVQPGGAVLVAGATGGVGQVLTAKLLERGYRVVALSRNPEKVRQLLGDAPGLDVVIGDMREPASLPSALAGVDAVCCCTGTTAFPSKRWDGNNGPEQTDFVAVRNLVEAAAPMGLKRFVLTTSAGVERQNKLPYIILNLFGVSHRKASCCGGI